MNVITEYKVKADKVDEQVVALSDFSQQLKILNNPHIKFTAYQLHDKVSFKHVTYIKDDETAKELMAQSFYAQLGESTVMRCEEAPTFTPMDMVATFKI